MLYETARSPGTPWLEEEKLDFLTFAPMKGALSHSSSQIVNFRGERVSAGRESSTEHVRRKLSTLPRSNYLQMCSETLLDPYLILNIHSDMSAGSGAKNRDVSDDDPTRRRSVCLCMKVRKHLQLLLWFCWCSWLKRRAQRWRWSLITSNNSLVCWSTVEETSHETNWSLLSGADLWWSQL